MIKEKVKKTKYNYKKTFAQVFVEYLRTIFISFFLAVIVTTGLAIRARNEMIEDIFAQKTNQEIIDKKIALEIISKTNLMKDLKNKKYSVCLHVGDLYKRAGDYANAQYAYELAVQKANINSYLSYYNLIVILVAQEKFDEAFSILESIKDQPNKKLVKFKTRAYMTIGDKYYSIGKFLSAAKAYEKSYFYYKKFTKKDGEVVKAIKKRIINSYIQTADIMVKSGLNSEALRFLRKAEQIDSKDFNIRYKMAIILSDADPEVAVKYFEDLLEEKPQDIDSSVYQTALMKAANIADLDNRPTQAKYYRYKIKSVDMFIARKVVYRNDVEIILKSMSVKKVFFKYPLKATYDFFNVANSDAYNLKADFVLCSGDEELETISMTVADKEKPLLMFSDKPNSVDLQFKKKIFTKKELENYTIKIYLYKDKKYKTLVFENKIPKKSF